ARGWFGDRGETRAEALVGTFPELAVREDVEVVPADAGEDTLAALLRTHPERRVRAFLQLALQRRVAGVGVPLRPRPPAFADVGLHRPGTERRDADPLARELAAKGLGEPDDRGLCGDVDRGAGDRKDARHRRRVDDVAALAVRQQPAQVG